MDVNLDRRVTIKRKVATQDATFRSETVTWQTLAIVWAELVDEPPSRSETLRQGLKQDARRTRVRIRYRTDVDSTMRIDYQGRELHIVGGPAELGRKEFLELVCEETSTQGEA
jgi:SPP1 family predicted phage head-tail adaptor